MSSFKALNIEYSDNESEAEPDNTKEIQIEDALKLYQTALKYHSEGAVSYDKAEEAYQALFQSEIFKYPESLTELQRIETFGPLPEADPLFDDNHDTVAVKGRLGGGDQAPNTLPQILHLSFKNYGQFLFDRFRAPRQAAPDDPNPSALVITNARQALDYFTDALDKDDTDLDLWTRTSAAASLAGSERIARYCLEGVVDSEDSGTLPIPGLEEGFAMLKLRQLAKKLADDVSLARVPLKPPKGKQKQISAIGLRRLDPFPYLPYDLVEKELVKLKESIPTHAARVPLAPPERNWFQVGELIKHLAFPELKPIPFHPTEGYIAPTGSAIDIVLPEKESGAVVTVPEEESANQQQNGQSNNDETSAASKPTQTPTITASGPSPEPNGDITMEDVEQPQPDQDVVQSTEGEQDGDQQKEERQSAEPTSSLVTILPSRKRSTGSAGLPEIADGGRGRSKRLRGGERATESTAQDPAKQFEQQLEPVVFADQALFKAINGLYEQLHATGLGSLETLQEQVSNATGLKSSNISEQSDVVLRDLLTCVQSSSPEITTILLTASSMDPLVDNLRETGLTAFLGYSKSPSADSSSKLNLDGDEGLEEFAKLVNKSWLHVREVAFVWIECLLSPGAFPSSIGAPWSSYQHHQWTSDLKQTVVQIALHLDDYLAERLGDAADALDECKKKDSSYSLSLKDLRLIEMVQTLFELHLDVYSLFKQSRNSVVPDMLILQKDRLERWSLAARTLISLRADCTEDDKPDELMLRHIWASAFHVTVEDDIPQEHVSLLIDDLKKTFASVGDPCIVLQNNAVMPELSIAAADRELQKINMKDFFLKIFDHDEQDPVVVIESLEPILEPFTDLEETEDKLNGDENGDSTPDPASLAIRRGPSPSEEMVKFLETASTPLRLSLWQQLRVAYEKIEYMPKVMSCYLRSIEVIIKEVKSSGYKEAATEQRSIQLMRWLRTIDEIFTKVLALNNRHKDALDCLDLHHLRSSIGALAEVTRLLHSFNIYEDMVRVGQISPPGLEGRARTNFPMVASKFHDMQTRCWMLQYILFGEAANQDSNAIEDIRSSKLEFLRVVHYALGIRGQCKAANRTFLRHMREELLQMIDLPNADLELSQVLFDLYGLKCTLNATEIFAHDTADSTESIDKKIALKLLDFLMHQTHKVSLKEVSKTDLRNAIDKVHGSLGQPKGCKEERELNKSMISSRLKSPINPVDLFRCVNGVGELPTKSISGDTAAIAKKGWYFLMGMLALSRFRSVKRVSAGPTEDLNISIAFFVQDLEYDTEKWETWYRLAQGHDLQIEECVSWSADKINGNQHDIVRHQRAAIHCYMLAVACAQRTAEATPETLGKLAELYADFALRIYASSRKPFNNEAFTIKETEHVFYSLQSSALPIKSGPWWPLRLYQAWKFAAGLFRRALAINPDNWMNQFMLGKCLWKMYTADESTRSMIRGDPIKYQDVVEAFVRAIEALPERRDSKQRKEPKEPILEPHYKVVSIACKLVQRRQIDFKEGLVILKATPYSQKIPEPEEFDGWEQYLLGVLKALRAADKSNWHHRISIRAANILYNETSADTMAAMAAKHELTQQIFTKTMAINIWKPEYERPGRHFVYTTCYTRFFIRLLTQLNDRVNMEQLTKRVRKRAIDFYEHQSLWHELVVAYTKILRRAGKVPEGHEEAIFKNLSYDEWSPKSARLESWCQSTTAQSPLLDVLKDVIELKKLNNGLTKNTLIDDLLGDTFALMYETILPTLEPEPEPPAPPPPNMMSVANVMNVDGAPEPPAPVEDAPKPRHRGVGRRELQKRAEAAVSRPVQPVTPAARPAAPQPAPTSNPQAPTEEQKPPKLLKENEVQDSAPASVHDSADDESESELSSLHDEDEMEEPEPISALKPLFPGLAARRESLADKEASKPGSGVNTPDAETENSAQKEEDK